MTAKIMKRRGGGGGYYNADGVTLKVKILVKYLKIFSEEKKQISTTQVSCSSGFSLNLPKTKVRCRLFKKCLRLVFVVVLAVVVVVVDVVVFVVAVVVVVVVVAVAVV